MNEPPVQTGAPASLGWAALRPRTGGFLMKEIKMGISSQTVPWRCQGLCRKRLPRITSLLGLPGCCFPQPSKSQWPLQSMRVHPGSQPDALNHGGQPQRLQILLPQVPLWWPPRTEHHCPQSREKEGREKRDILAEKETVNFREMILDFGLLPWDPGKGFQRSSTNAFGWDRVTQV